MLLDIPGRTKRASVKIKKPLTVIGILIVISFYSSSCIFVLEKPNPIVPVMKQEQQQAIEMRLTRASIDETIYACRKYYAECGFENLNGTPVLMFLKDGKKDKEYPLAVNKNGLYGADFSLLPGTYTAMIEVRSGNSTKSFNPNCIVNVKANNPKIMKIDVPQTSVIDTDVRVSAKAVEYECLEQFVFEVKNGDNIIASLSGVNGVLDGRINIKTAGIYTYILRVRDCCGQETSDTGKLTVYTPGHMPESSGGSECGCGPQ